MKMLLVTRPVVTPRRNTHLKVCGISRNGLKPEDLVKVRRLEEKQAAEWADLGLPKPSAKTKVTSRKRTTPSSNAGPYEAGMATIVCTPRERHDD